MIHLKVRRPKDRECDEVEYDGGQKPHNEPHPCTKNKKDPKALCVGRNEIIERDDFFPTKLPPNKKPQGWK
jgi:hypothetical protein